LHLHLVSSLHSACFLRREKKYHFKTSRLDAKMILPEQHSYTDILRGVNEEKAKLLITSLFLKVLLSA